jgi:hypothetical protein
LILALVVFLLRHRPRLALDRDAFGERELGGTRLRADALSRPLERQLLRRAAEIGRHRGVHGDVAHQLY